jgi:hypothetical protein
VLTSSHSKKLMCYKINYNTFENVRHKATRIFRNERNWAISERYMNKLKINSKKKILDLYRDVI